MGRPVDRDRLEVLALVAPGTALREGLDAILHARAGALIVHGDSGAVNDVVRGGFAVDVPYSPSALFQLAKLDGAIILSQDGRRIVRANAELVPDPSIPTAETGMRHRAAERVARQTGELVITISERRRVVTLYRGAIRYALGDLEFILNKAGQALETLEKYRAAHAQAAANLSALEFEDLATLADAARVAQRAEMVLRIGDEIGRYLAELGEEGRLVRLQQDELSAGLGEEGRLVVRDYARAGGPDPDEVWEGLAGWKAAELLDLGALSRALGYGGTPAAMDTPVTPRGYRILSKIPRLPPGVVTNLVAHFGSLPAILRATTDELDTVEGIGEARARAIKDGLRRLRDQVLFEQGR